MSDPKWERPWLCMSELSPGGWRNNLGDMGRRSEQVLHLKSAAEVRYLPSWPLDTTASRLSSTLTTVSTFSLEGRREELRESNRRAVPGSSSWW